MADSPQTISLSALLLAFIPAALVVLILHRWTQQGRESGYALARMLGQLLIIGYFLTFIFATENGYIVLAVLMVMVTVSSWIALRSVPMQRSQLYPMALVSILLGAGLPLLVSTQLVLRIEPFYSTQFMVPLAGMVFASAMNSVGIGAERWQSERAGGADLVTARATALSAALIPVINSLFAVGLVSLPGMMTGQILAGVEPLIAVRYQIMVMCMLFASSGLSCAGFLFLLTRRETDN